jgi:hypothetical protein
LAILTFVIPDLPAPAKAGDPGSMNTELEEKAPKSVIFSRSVFMDAESSSA